MNHPSHVYYHQAQGQGPMAAPGGPPGYFPQVAYGMLGGERPGYPAATAPPPYPSPYLPDRYGTIRGIPCFPCTPSCPGKGDWRFFQFRQRTLCDRHPGGSRGDLPVDQRNGATGHDQISGQGLAHYAGRL